MTWKFCCIISAKLHLRSQFTQFSLFTLQGLSVHMPMGRVGRGRSGQKRDAIFLNCCFFIDRFIDVNGRTGKTFIHIVYVRMYVRMYVRLYFVLLQ